MNKLFRTCALGGCQIVPEIPMMDDWDSNSTTLDESSLMSRTEPPTSNPPWIMTERDRHQTTQRRISDRKVVKINQVKFR